MLFRSQLKNEVKTQATNNGNNLLAKIKNIGQSNHGDVKIDTKQIESLQEKIRNQTETILGLRAKLNAKLTPTFVSVPEYKEMKDSNIQTDVQEETIIEDSKKVIELEKVLTNLHAEYNV